MYYVHVYIQSIFCSSYLITLMLNQKWQNPGQSQRGLGRRSKIPYNTNVQLLIQKTTPYPYTLKKQQCKDFDKTKAN